MSAIDPSTDQTIKILLLTGMYPWSEMPRNGVAVKRQADSLRELGIDLDVFHLRDRTHSSFIASMGALRRTLAAKAYDFVHIHYGVKATLLSLVARIPVIATYHGTDVNGLTWKGRRLLSKRVMINLAAWVVRQLSRRLKIVIVMSEEMKSRLPRSVRKRTSVIPMGVDTTLFTPMDRIEARTSLEWGDEAVVLFSNNATEVIKRQDLAEAAIEVLQKSGFNVRLQVMCDIVPIQVPTLMAAADCLLVTSDKEGSPNVVREATCCRLPVVSVPVGDVPEHMRKWPKAGRIVQRTPESIAAGIREVLQSDVDIPLGDTVRELSLEAVAERVLKVYRGVVRNE